jgi:hypothetical protein
MFTRGINGQPDVGNRPHLAGLGLRTRPCVSDRALLSLLWQMTLPTVGAPNGGPAGNRDVKGEEGTGK